jgi:hypothetical protein
LTALEDRESGYYKALLLSAILLDYLKTFKNTNQCIKLSLFEILFWGDGEGQDLIVL